MTSVGKYGGLTLFSALFGIGLLVRYAFGTQSTLWDLWNTVDISFAVALGILAFIAYRDIVREKDQIRLIFDVKEETKIDTGLCLLRKDCTRSEVIGLIEMLKKSDAPLKYDVKHLHTLLNELNRVQSGKAGKLYIPVHPEEMSQFDLRP